MNNARAQHIPPTHRLRYGNDRVPGIRRLPGPDGAFRYVHPDGSAVGDDETLARIRALAIPPAYEDIWISPDPNSHLQATGRDKRGRKQYRYHVQWRQARDANKFHHMIAFGEALPMIRARVHSDLALSGLPREKVLATLVRLLETTLIRVGNEEYARSNHSFGLTTMRVNHVDIEGSMLHFSFRGKSGKHHRIDLRDPRLARIVARCKELPGREVFEYVDGAGAAHTVRSEDVNGYLHEIGGAEFTAKDFRTWAGTVTAFVLLCECAPCRTSSEIRRNMVQVAERAAERLGNTPAVCRRAYIHPEVFSAYEAGDLARSAAEAHPSSIGSGLRAEETALLNFLRSRQIKSTRKAARTARSQP